MPFTREEFLHVFAQYNQAIWPAQVVLYALALLSLVVIAGKNRLSDRLAVAVLIIMWVMAGAVYHIAFFSTINPVARVFGALFLLQAVLLVVQGIARNRVHLEFGRDVRTWMGWILVGYAMVIYPVIGMLFGHGYPAAPMFGVTPCPIVIYTFGLFLWARDEFPAHLVIIPAIWSLIGSTAALKFGIYQDYGLLAACLIAVPAIVRHKAALDAARQPG